MKTYVYEILQRFTSIEMLSYETRHNITTYLLDLGFTLNNDFESCLSSVLHKELKGKYNIRVLNGPNHDEIINLIEKYFKKHTGILEISVHDNIGQVKLESADAEIERLNRNNNGIWIKDFSLEMFCYDETDYNVSNPTPLSSGYCWIIRKR
jgi:hypothetical protein